MTWEIELWETEAAEDPSVPGGIRSGLPVRRPGFTIEAPTEDLARPVLRQALRAMGFTYVKSVNLLERRDGTRYFYVIAQRLSPRADWHLRGGVVPHVRPRG